LATLHFYATSDDLRNLLQFVYTETDFRVFEAYSRVNHDLREFIDLTDFDRERPADASHGKLHLDLISPSVSDGPEIIQFKLNESAGGGIRSRVQDPSAARIVEGGIRRDIEGKPLYWTDFAHWSEKGARQRANYSDERLDQINWRELERLSRRLVRQIKVKVAVAKYHSRPILPDAFRQMESGLNLWRGPGLLDKHSEEITRLR